MWWFTMQESIILVVESLVIRGQKDLRQRSLQIVVGLNFNEGHYDAFLAEMTRLGRKDYDAYLNIKVQENAEKRGIELKACEVFWKW